MKQAELIKRSDHTEMLTTYWRGDDKNFHSWQRQSTKSGKKPAPPPHSSRRFQRASRLTRHLVTPAPPDSRGSRREFPLPWGLRFADDWLLKRRDEIILDPAYDRFFVGRFLRAP